jgi:SAM-dependent methyltransferase
MAQETRAEAGLASKHYGEDYFAWQTKVGEFGGWANLAKFDRWVRETDTVLDFGCGGGFLLKRLNCRRKLGVEPSRTAGEVARQNGVEVFTRADEVPDNLVDVVISNHALEHALSPLTELQTLFAKLRPGGKIVFVVPCESIRCGYQPGNIHHHLYSWSPMCLGNLFTEAGFTVVESKPYLHKWPPLYRHVARLGGRMGFDLACRIYGRLERSWFQVRTIGEKPRP